jgi:hypothetical protein
LLARTGKLTTMTHTEFNAAWKRIGDKYWTRSKRAESCWRTKDMGERERAARRRYQVELRRLRAQCGCTGCKLA